MMVAAQAIPAVWVYTTGDAFNAMRGGGYGAFLTPSSRPGSSASARPGCSSTASTASTSWTRGGRSSTSRRSASAPGHPAVPHVQRARADQPQEAPTCSSARSRWSGRDDEIQAALADLADRCASTALLRRAGRSYEAEASWRRASRTGRSTSARSRPTRSSRSASWARTGSTAVRPLPPEERRHRAGRSGCCWRRPTARVDRARSSTSSTTTSAPQEIGARPVAAAEGADPLVPVVPTGIDRNTITWVPTSWSAAGR
jgi:hypothetical protein